MDYLEGDGSEVNSRVIVFIRHKGRMPDIKILLTLSPILFCFYWLNVQYREKIYSTDQYVEKAQYYPVREGPPMFGPSHSFDLLV
jgi:hypothetical protein